MRLEDKTLHLNKFGKPNMSKKLTYYSIDDLYRLYPGTEERGWTKHDLLLWIQQDIISGKYVDENPSTVEVEKESFEAFLDYHTQFLKRRAERVVEGLHGLQKVNSKQKP
ncbi:MAG: hypothetical protein HUJ25_07555 [Crocinitomicaceae bacterium]|nr:hypothetical protein [Crocinitomicaceae bacterium]